MHFKHFEGSNSRIKRTIFEKYIVSNLYHDMSMFSSAMEKNEFILLKYNKILDNNLALYNYN